MEAMLSDEKFADICRAHVDGIYMFSSRKNCDELVTRLFNEYMRLYNYTITRNEY